MKRRLVTMTVQSPLRSCLFFQKQHIHHQLSVHLTELDTGRLCCQRIRPIVLVTTTTTATVIVMVSVLVSLNRRRRI